MPTQNLQVKELPHKKQLNTDDLEFLENFFGANPDASRDIYGWMVDHFDDYDSIEIVDEAIDQWGDRYYDLDDDYFEELVTYLYSEQQ